MTDGRFTVYPSSLIEFPPRPGTLTAGVPAAFLLSRRTHSAVVEYFYPECFQAVLALAIVSLRQARGALFWPVVLLMLMTKEDAALYLSGFAVVALGTRQMTATRCSVLLLVSMTWFGLALGLAIPASRSAQGLEPVNGLFESRFGDPERGVTPKVLAERVFSRHTLDTLGTLAAGTGVLPLLGPEWLAASLPGVVANLGASPDSGQSGLVGHYAWPVLPWLYLGLAAGLGRVARRAPRLAAAWLVVLLVATAADNPALRGLHTRADSLESAALRQQLQALDAPTILAQPNLIPHLGYSSTIYALGGRSPAPQSPDLVLITPVGNLWPLTATDVQALISRYRADSAYSEVSSGPLFAFRRRAD